MPDGKRHVLVLTSTFPRVLGDAEPRFVLDLCDQLANDFRITVLAPHASGAPEHEQLGQLAVRRFRYAPVAWEQLAYDGGIMPKLRSHPLLWLVVPLFLLGQVLAIRRCLHRDPVDIIHAHWLIPQALCAWLAQGLGQKVPVLCTVHGADIFSMRSAPLRALQSFLGRRCARIGAVSTAVAEALRSRGIDASKIEILPMGVPLPEVRDPACDESGAGLQLAFAGRLVAKKGVLTLLRAFRRVLDVQPEARLTIAGGGPEALRCQALSRELGLDAHVRFLGPVAQTAILELFAQSSIAVVPSEVSADGDSEGLGLVALEAMAAGCPVVASDLPAFRTFIEDGRTGFLFPSGDAQALATTLIEIGRDARRRRDVARAGQSTAISEFGWERAGQRYRATLHAMLAAGQ